MNNHDSIIYAIVGLIICIQLFFFLKNLKKIWAYKNIIASNKELSVIELSIDEDKVTTMDPEYFIENKNLFGNRKILEPEVYVEEGENPETHHLNYEEDILEEEERDDIYQFTQDDGYDYDDDNNDEENLNLFS